MGTDSVFAKQRTAPRRHQPWQFQQPPSIPQLSIISRQPHTATNDPNSSAKPLNASLLLNIWACLTRVLNRSRMRTDHLDAFTKKVPAATSYGLTGTMKL